MAGVGETQIPIKWTGGCLSKQEEKMYVVKIRMKSTFLNLGDWYATQESFENLEAALNYAALFPRRLFDVRIEV